jgi:hypothetical protein
VTHEEQDVFVPFANGATVVAMPMPPASPPGAARPPNAPAAQEQAPARERPAPREQQPAAAAQGQPAAQGRSGDGAVRGDGLPDPLRAELHELFLHSGAQLRSTYQAHLGRPDLATPSALLPFTDCATAGAVAGRLAVINAVLHYRRPGGPATARQTASAVRGMLKRATDTSRTHLTGVLAALDELAGDPTAAQREDADLGAAAARLEDALHTSPGVYVYTYPHYWRHPYVPGTERRLLKLGKTGGATFAQLRAQARQIGAPEDPLLLRVYVTDEPGASEHTFHRLLDAAEHTRGEEWFSTTLEFCDEIATALRLEILEADVPV